MKTTCKHTILKKIQVYLTLLLFTLVSACNDLSVFVPSNSNASIDSLNGIYLNEDGRLSLAWASKLTAAQGNYDIYLLQIDKDDELYKFDANSITEDPLVYQMIRGIPTEKTPRKTGTLLENVSSLSFVVEDILTPGKTYAIEVIDSRAPLKMNSKIVLIRIDFPNELSGTASSEIGSSKLVWNSVPGANRYEIFADEAMTRKLGESTSNELSLSTQATVGIKDFYIKAYRGFMPANGLAKISLSGSIATILKVQTTSSDGKYKAGDTLDFLVTFSQKVTSYGDSSLPLVLDGKTVYAEYVSGSGTTQHTFRHIVGQGEDTDLLRTGALLVGDYLDEAELSVAPILPIDTSLDSLKRSSAIAIDTTLPTVPASVGFASAFSVSGSETVSWTSSTDKHFLQHRLKLCSDTNCSADCGSEQTITGQSLPLTGLPEGIYYACVRGEDTFGNLSLSASSITPLRVDSSAPTVSRVFAQSAAGTYSLGQTITLAVQFTEAVVATGVLHLTVNGGGAPHDAVYSSGSGTNTLLFNYTVQSDDLTSDLNYSAPSSLAFAGAGALVDLAGNNAVLTLPPTNDGNSLAGQSAIALDGVLPTVVRAYSISANGSYTTPQLISLAVEMSETVQLDTPNNLALTLDVGGATRLATYSSGNGTATLQFTYELVTGDFNTDLDYASTNSLAFNGAGTLRDGAGNSGNLTLPNTGSGMSLSGQSEILIDARSPLVSRVYSTSTDGVYGAPSDILISVEMNEPVTLTDANNLRLQLETGATDGYATYDSLTGSTIINFRYAVQTGDVTGDLDYLNISSLAFNGSGTMVDALSNAANLELPAIGNVNSLGEQSSISIDTSDFKVNYVQAATANGSYKAGATITLNVVFNKVVTVTDSANLKLTLATGMFEEDADYVSGSGTTTLVFNYEVQAGNISPDLNYASNTALHYINGSTGTVTDPGNQVATLFLPATGSADSLGTRSAIVIDTLDPAVIHVREATASGPYKEGDVITLSVEFSEPISDLGTGAMLLDLDMGGRVATYVGPIDSTHLGFEYEVQAGDNTSDLDYLNTSALIMDPTMIFRDAAGNDASLVLPTPGTANSLAGQSTIVIDTTAPTVERVYSDTTDGTYKVGTTLTLKVEMSEAVILSAPQTMTLALATGVVHEATLTGGSGTDTLTFTYAIQAGDNSADLDYETTASLLLTGGSLLEDTVGNTAVRTLPALASANSLAGQADLVIDTTAPNVNRIYSQTSAGSYTTPSNIDLIIEFSEPVTVNSPSNLRLALDLTPTSRDAEHLSSTGNNEVRLRYAIQTGDTSADLDYIATNSLSFDTAGSIQDAVGNLSPLTLPAIADANSLAVQSAIVIDALAPNAPVITAPADNSTATVPITSMSGTAEADSTITIYKNSVSQGTATTDGSGNWSYNLSPTLLNGTYDLSATAQDSLANVSAETVHTVTVAIPMPTSNAGADFYTATTVSATGSTTGAVTRTWTKQSGTGTISFGTPNADSTTISSDTEGSFVLRLSATNANNDTVSDDLTFVWDTSAPTFRGLQNVTQVSSTSSRLFWAAALDNLTPHDEIIYEMCYSTAVGSCATSFVVAQTFHSQTTDFLATGLTPGLTYEFLIRAVDKAGNFSYGSGPQLNTGLRGYTQIAGGGHNFCALMSDQSVKCWGDNDWYQLGQGGTDVRDRNNPTTVPGLTGVKKISVAHYNGCAIMSDDTVKCWGYNVDNELGDGTAINRSSPVPVVGLTNVADLASGERSTCAIIKVTGEVYCWGSNSHGQLGDGTNDNSATPLAISGLSGVTAIAAGNLFFCAVLSDKTVKCWGKNTSGQYGNNTNTTSSTPVASSVVNVEQIDAGEAHVCAVITGGAVKCWGYNNSGRVGDGTTTNRWLPTDVVGLSSGVSKVSLGWPHSCALMVDQTVKCWGGNVWTNVGNNQVSEVLTPYTVPGATGVTDLVSANDTNCAVFASGALKCWGRDDAGQAGDGAVVTRVSPTTVLGLGGTPVKLEAGHEFTCALMSDKTVKCWGANQWLSLGDPTATSGNAVFSYPEPRTVAGLTDVEVLKVGGYHACAVLTDTTVKCWGYNAEGQLGNGTTTSSATPQTVVSTSGTGSLSGIVDLIIGKIVTCAINGAGAMYCWGSADYGQLGDGHVSPQTSIPILATAYAGPIKTGAAGNVHLCVILDNPAKTVQCVGHNGLVQLNDFTQTHRTTPITTTVSGALSITSFQDHTCVKQSGTVTCWGPNSVGEMGIGSTTTWFNAVTPLEASTFTSIEAGRSFTCATLSGGRVKCFGENDWDRLGRPDIVANDNQLNPAFVTGLKDVASLALGERHVCALMQDSSIKCWGMNDRNQLGLANQAVANLFINQEVSSGTIGD